MLAVWSIANLQHYKLYPNEFAKLSLDTINSIETQTEFSQLYPTIGFICAKSASHYGEFIYRQGSKAADSL